MITVRECQYDEVEKFRKLEGEYHYMGKSHGAGEMICATILDGPDEGSVVLVRRPTRP